MAGSAVARQRQDAEEQQAAGNEVKAINAEVTGVSSRPHGELVISLSNGQTWAQKKSERYFPIAAGDRVAINAGVLGSYHLVNGKRSTQVTRVK